jgi:hypothetical protein
MSNELKAETLFLDSDKINLLGTTANDATYPFFDFNFEEGDLRTEAVLTFNADEETWHGVIRIAEDKDADFDDGHDATAEQLAALKAKLPTNSQNLIAIFRSECGPSPKF